MALTTTGLFLLSSLDKSSPLFFIFICLVVLGLGFALFSSPNTNAIMSSVEKNYLAVASGMVGTMRLVGQMLSMGIAMLLFAVIIGEVEITEEYYTPFLKSIDIAYLIFAVLCFLGIFASLARGRLRKKS
jgi:uncharacterized membrane protein HdeD (DUF308 family)